jgi:hypothetical protein
MRTTISVLTTAAVCAAVTIVSGCSRAPQVGQQVHQELLPIATVQDIMHFQVEPSAFFVWESVGTEITAQGTLEKSPHSDAEWADVRGRAVLLAEAANLLLLKGRLVAAQGKVLADSDVKGISSPADIQKTIDAKQSQFYAYALALRGASQRAIEAIDARNTTALVEAGGGIDDVCESCHSTFWYPNAAAPPQ